VILGRFASSHFPSKVVACLNFIRHLAYIDVNLPWLTCHFKSYDHTTHGPKIIFEYKLILLTTSIKISKNHFLAYQVLRVKIANLQTKHLQVNETKQKEPLEFSN
jgi:hypothetical protein